MNRCEVIRNISVGLLCLTVVAQLGGEHSQIHLDLSKAAMFSESLTLASALLAIGVKETHQHASQMFEMIAGQMLIVTGNFFLKVALTDPDYQMFYHDGRSIYNLEDNWLFLQQYLIPDFSRHMTTGFSFLLQR